MIVQPVITVDKKPRVYTWAHLHAGDETDWQLVGALPPADAAWVQTLGLWVPGGVAELVLEAVTQPDFSDVTRITSYDLPFGPAGLRTTESPWFAFRFRVNQAMAGTDITVRAVLLT